MAKRPSVYLSGYNASIADMYHKRDYNVVAMPEDADFIQFIGGADVDPGMYKQRIHPTTHTNPAADKRDLVSLSRSVKLGLPCVGICRGGQFLNVVAGGKMYQHVSNHGNGHQIKDLRSGLDITVSSTHHQMMIPGPDAQILAVAHESRTREYMEGENIVCEFRSDEEPDYEVLWYPTKRYLCFQPHPEMKPYSQTGNTYFFELLEEFIVKR